MQQISPLAEDKPYTFRPYLLEDIPFIQNSWGNSYYPGVNGNTLLTPDEFHKRHRPIRDQILHRPNIAIIVCCAHDDPNLIIGYSIVEKPDCPGLILHYVYVKQAFKNEGIAKHLLKTSCNDRPVMYTHQTIIINKIVQKYKARAREDLERFFFCPHMI